MPSVLPPSRAAAYSCAPPHPQAVTCPMKALDGLVVLDLTHMVAGPFATMVLADLGAETIKIEPPGGEATRRLLADQPAYQIDGLSAYLLALSCNKKSLGLDLKSENGLALFLRLTEAADVVVDNFSPGVTRRLGIDPATLGARNPRVVTCSITGFGGESDAGRTAFDLVAQGMGGGMSVTGEPDGRPVRAGIPIGDLGAALFAVIGIQAALAARERSGTGQHVDIAMLDGQISLLTYMATMALMDGRPPGRVGNGHVNHVPYDTFATRTRDLIVAVVTDHHWQALVEELGRDDLREPAYATAAGRLAARDKITAVLRQALAADTCEAWLARLDARRIPAAPVNDMLAALGDSQVLARNMVVDLALAGGTAGVPGNPVKLSATPGEDFAPPPAVGADTDAVLRDKLGLDTAEIAALRDAGVVA